MKRRLFALLLPVLAASAAEEGSRLDAFSRDVAKQDATPRHASASEDAERGDLYSDLFGGFLGEVFVGGLWYGGASSLARIDEDHAIEDTDENFTRRAGEPLIPFLRLDADRQWIEPGLDAWNVAAEVGYGPIALRGRMQRYEEDEPDAELDLYETALLYRMSFGRHVEIDLGGGAVLLDGAANEARGTFTPALRIYPRPGFGLEFRSTLAQRLEIYDVALLAGPHFLGVKAGWRWTRSPDESLDGPYAGIAVSF